MSEIRINREKGKVHIDKGFTRGWVFNDNENLADAVEEMELSQSEKESIKRRLGLDK